MADRTVTVRMRMDVGGAIASARAFGTAVGDMTKQAVTGAVAMSTATERMTAKQKTAYEATGRRATLMAVGLVGGFALATKAALTFDKQMSSVAANSGAHGRALDQLRQSALAAGRDTAFSATQAAQGEDELAKAGVSVTDIVNGGLKGALSLAAAGQIDVADAAETAATAMTQFHLSGAAVPHIADLLSAAANKAQGGVGDMARALKQGGLVASQFGLSVDDTVGTLAAFASAGLIGADSGTSFKQMLLSLAKPTTAASDTMRQLGINAFDASGKFVGVTALAGQLHDKLSGLSQAQRTSALATIFGSDAIRAANVLYTQGAGGIQGWIGKVDDAGNASRTASAKMNNLAGDLKQLQGSFQTALIQSGSEANGTLRGLVQTATAAVNVFSALPGPVQGGVVALAGVSGAAILGAKGMLSVVTTVREAKEAWTGWRAAVQSGQGVTGKLGAAVKGTAGAIVGPLGIALAGGAALLGVWIARQEAAKARLASLTDAIQQDAGAIGTNTRAWIVNELQTRKFGDSGQTVIQAAKGMGINLASLTDAMLGEGTASQQLQSQLQSQIDVQTALLHSGKIGVEQYKQRTGAAQELLGILRGENGALNKASQAARDHAAAMATGTTAQQQAAAAAVQHADDESKLATALSDASQSADDLKNALDTLSGANISADQAAIDQAKSAIAAKQAADSRTGASLKEKQALLDLAQADQKQLVAMKANGASGDQLNAKIGTLRDQFVALATKMTGSKKAAEDLANRYGLIASKSPIKVDLDDGEFLTKLHSAQGLTIDPKTGLLLGNNADYFNKWLRAKGLRLDPKTGLFRGNNSDYINKWMKANGLHINTKTGNIVGNTTGFWSSVHSIPQVVGTRTIDVRLSGARPDLQADGNVISSAGVKRFADGGQNTRHDLPAHIATQPTVLFGEPETGGEAFIPLGLSKRHRSTRLLSEVAGMFGLRLVKPMADGGVLSTFANGGIGGDFSLSSILSEWTTAVKPSTKAQVDAAIRNRRTQLNQLASAEDALARARRRGSSRDIAAAERRIAAERADLASATSKLADVEARFKFAQQKPAQQLGSALGLDIKAKGAFIKNLQTLADRGFGVLAQQLLAMGGPDAERIAADAVKLSNSKLRSLQNQVTQAQQQQQTLNNLPAILDVKTAIKAGKGGSWVGLLNATGLTPDVLALAVKSMTTELSKTAAGRALIADMHAHGFAHGGEVTGRPGVDTNLIRATAGEYVINAGSTARYRPWLEAINGDRLDQFVRHLVSGASGGRWSGASSQPTQTGPTFNQSFQTQDMDVHELARNVARETAWALSV